MIKHQFPKWLPIVKHEDHLSQTPKIDRLISLSNTLALVSAPRGFLPSLVVPLSSNATIR